MNAMPVVGKTASRTAPRDGFDVLDETHRRMLDVTSDLERLIASLEGRDASPEERAQASAIAAFYASTVRQHHADEEKHVFPPLLRGSEEVVQAVLRLQQDHGWLEEDWLELEPHLQALATGYGVCDRDLLRSGVAVFVALLRDHVELEEALIYPEARARLGNAARQQLGRELAQRRHSQRKAAGSVPPL